MSLESLHRGWQQMAENRIQAAMEEGAFDNLPGLGRPLEEIMDLDDPYGWARRAVRDVKAERAAHSREAIHSSTSRSSTGSGTEPAPKTRS